MKVGITGSTGLIGTALIETLSAAGHQAVPFIRSKEAVNGSVRWSPRDRVVNEDDITAAGGVDAVVHLAGAGIADKRWTSQRRREILESRVGGTETLARWIADTAQPPSVLLSGSAIGFYGNRGDDILDENSDGGTGFLADVCRAWEAPANAIERPGVRVAILRTGIVMSPRGGALKKQLPLFRAGLGGRLGSGQQWSSSISLRDTSAALLHLLTHPVQGPVNLVAPEPARNKDVTKAIAAAVHRPAPFPVPPVALAVALGKDCAEEMLLASQRILPRRLVDSGFTFRDHTIAAIAEWACSDAAR